ncbi:MAG: hypothetical protein O3B27_06100 [Actinomycetota bacterium]|nr:hypothetical protein [Actinomycetota bacterium]
MPELTAIEHQRRRAMASTLQELGKLARAGALDEAALNASLGQLAHLGAAHDIDALHIPADAGGHRAGLVAVMVRIPDGWGRWISCDAGWYRLITDLDAALAALDLDYVIHQVKEKFGTLRFYAETDLVGELATEFAALIDAAEAASAQTCERCGADAQMCSTGQFYQLYKTLCESCREQLQVDDGIRYRLVRASAAIDTGGTNPHGFHDSP